MSMNEMTRLVPASDEEVRTRLTTAEFLHMDECGAFDDLKVELVDGELHFMQRPKNNHAMRQAQLVVRLAAVIGEDRVRGELAIDLGDATILTCDAAVLCHPIGEDRMLVPDDLLLVVEVAETTRKRDLGMKRGKYAAGNIAHYWVVDGTNGVAHLHSEPVDGDYVEVHTARFGQPMAVPGTDATITLS
jgi:Uma2 family endonuclease